MNDEDKTPQARGQLFLLRGVSMPAQPLVDYDIIIKLLNEYADLGMTGNEVDIVIARHGPVDLDLLQLCKRNHPAFERSMGKKRKGRR